MPSIASPPPHSSAAHYRCFLRDAAPTAPKSITVFKSKRMAAQRAHDGATSIRQCDEHMVETRRSAGLCCVNGSFRVQKS
ncbi:hypothetical protein U1Q18_031137 [Sarracenia purpurea var. burkii]